MFILGICLNGQKGLCVTSAGAFFIASITEPKLDPLTSSILNPFGEANFGLSTQRKIALCKNAMPSAVPTPRTAKNSATI